MVSGVISLHEVYMPMAESEVAIVPTRADRSGCLDTVQLTVLVAKLYTVHLLHRCMPALVVSCFLAGQLPVRTIIRQQAVNMRLCFVVVAMA